MATIADAAPGALSSSVRSTERRFYLGLCVALGMGFVTLGFSEHPIGFPLDDAYITIHNAQVLYSGQDQNYPGVSVLAGATSLVHLALVAAFMSVLSPIAACFAAGAVAVMLYATGLARLAFQARRSLPFVALITAAGLCAGYAPFQLLNGLETGLAMAAVAWACVFANEVRNTIKLPLLCGLLPFIRPELAFLSAVLLAGQAYRRWRADEGLAMIAIDFATAGCVAAPWLAWSWLSLGSVLSPTASAKIAYFAQAALPNREKLRLMWDGLLQSLTLLLLIGAFILRPRSLLWVFVLALLVAFYATFPGGLSQNYSRYVFVTLPLCLGLLAQGVQGGPLTAALVLVLCTLSMLSTPFVLAKFQSETEFRQDAGKDLVRWADAAIPPDATVLVHDAGEAAFFTKLHLVDLVGLKTPESVAYHRLLTAPSGGALRGKAISEIARRFHVGYAIILDDPSHFWGVIKDDLIQQGWTLTPVDVPSKKKGYNLYRLRSVN